jgi:AcrR family transcriptional regulator
MTEPSFMALRRDHLRRRGEAEYLKKRAEIVTAAAGVFKRKGFRSTSIADIAAATGMDRATLYLYIAGKEDVFHAVIQDAVEANVAMAEALAISDRPAPERLEQFITALIISYERHHPFLFVYVQENMTQLDDGSEWGRAMRELGRRFDDAVIGIVRQGMDDGSLRAGKGSAKVIAYGLIGLCNWTHRWFDPSGPASAAEIAETYSAMILDGLVARP